MVGTSSNAEPPLRPPLGLRALIVRHGRLLVINTESPEGAVCTLPGGPWSEGTSLVETLSAYVRDQTDLHLARPRLAYLVESRDEGRGRDEAPVTLYFAGRAVGAVAEEAPVPGRAGATLSWAPWTVVARAALHPRAFRDAVVLDGPRRFPRVRTLGPGL